MFSIITGARGHRGRQIPLWDGKMIKWGGRPGSSQSLRNAKMARRGGFRAGKSHQLQELDVRGARNSIVSAEELRLR